LRKEVSMMMRRRKNWVWGGVFAILLLMCLPACQYELVKKKRTVATSEEEKALREGEERKLFEESLTAKRYPGIEGEVLESPFLKDMYFAFDRYDLTDGARRILTENAKVLLAHPNIIIQIEGHCDERGSNEYNLALGERRSVSAKLYLIKLGVKGNRFSTISYGEEMPVDPGHTEEAWAKNRRCHFVILSR
jgi:peptidoglycan-associated lipoprotein